MASATVHSIQILNGGEFLQDFTFSTKPEDLHLQTSSAEDDVWTWRMAVCGLSSTASSLVEVPGPGPGLGLMVFIVL